MLNEKKRQMEQLKLVVGPEEFERVLHSNELLCQFNVYVLDVKDKGTDLARFWQSYLELCELMLNLIYATRTGSWDCTFLVWKKSYHGLLIMIARTTLATLSHSSMTCADCQPQCLKCILPLKKASSLFK